MSGPDNSLSGEAKKSRDRRSIAIALGVAAFVIVVYFVTMMQLANNVGGRP
jgi:CHASE2 domain-containing sensor protein